MLQEENPIISGEELQVIEAGDSGINSCPVQQYSVEEGDQSSGKPITRRTSLRMVQQHAFCPKRKHAEAHVNNMVSSNIH